MGARLNQILICLFFILGQLLTNANPAAASNDKTEEKIPVSVAAKLYWVAQAMDSHDKWDKASELLREILQKDLDNDYVTSRIKKVKQYVDGEWKRQLSAKVTNSQLDSHTFLEARLLIIECIQELRPRLNLSWTGEVRLLNKLLFTAIFPHAEEYGEIELPPPSTYSFDTYGYTVKNLRNLMLSKGGSDLQKLFPEFLVTAKQKKQYQDELGSSTMSFKKITRFKDRIAASLKAEGLDPDKKFADDFFDPAKNDDTPFWNQSDSDWDYWSKSEAEKQLLSLKRAYQYLTDALKVVNNHRSIDEYEPLTLLMIAVANPGLIEADPQLRDFISGVKLKYKISNTGSNGVSFKPKDYQLVDLINDSIVPQLGLKLQFEVNPKTGQKILYVVSNLNGSTNLVHNLFAFKNLIAVIQGFRYLPPNVIQYAKNTPQNLLTIAKALNKIFAEWGNKPSFVFSTIGTAGELVLNIAANTGGKVLVRSAKSTNFIFSKIIENPTFAKTFEVVQSERFLHALVAVSITADLIQASTQLVNVPPDFPKSKIVLSTSASIASTLIYLTKVRSAILLASTLDLAHLFYNKVPSVAQILDYYFNFIYEKIYQIKTGATPLQEWLVKVQNQLALKPNSDALKILKDFENGIASASKLEDLELTRKTLEDALGFYAAKRLFFQYFAITSLNGKGREELGVQLKTFNDEYDRLFWTWYDVKTSQQLGLAALDKKFDEKWIILGGKPPAPPTTTPDPNTPAPAPTNPNSPTPMPDFPLKKK